MTTYLYVCTYPYPIRPQLQWVAHVPLRAGCQLAVLGVQLCMTTFFFNIFGGAMCLPTMRASIAEPQASNILPCCSEGMIVLPNLV